MRHSASDSMIRHSFREEDPKLQKKMKKLKYKGRKDHTTDRGEIPFSFIMREMERNLTNCTKKNMKLNIIKQSFDPFSPSLRRNFPF